jgi:hypothetical protein
MRLGRAAVACLFALTVEPAAIGPLKAEPLPMPRVDYEAKATLSGRGNIVVRHHEGKLRLDFDAAESGVKMTGIFDLASRKLQMTMPVPGAKMAIEMDLKDEAGLGQATGDGTRVGTATVAGETCDIWHVTKTQSANTVAACITKDGINLRTQLGIDGQARAIMEVTELTRSAQDLSLFRLPPDVKIVKTPAGLGGLPADLLGGAPKR